jgi:hypothetical protein
MNTIQKAYQTVIDHIAADIETLKQDGHIADTLSLYKLEKRREWLISRKDRLNGQRKKAISEFNNRLDAYLRQCEKFWKAQHERAYEKKLKQLDETKKRVIAIYSLSGFDACYALLLALKHLRAILPLAQYADYKPLLAALEGIKEDCQKQLSTYINP